MTPLERRNLEALLEHRELINYSGWTWIMGLLMIQDPEAELTPRQRARVARLRAGTDPEFSESVEWDWEGEGKG